MALMRHVHLPILSGIRILIAWQICCCTFCACHLGIGIWVVQMTLRSVSFAPRVRLRVLRDVRLGTSCSWTIPESPTFLKRIYHANKLMPQPFSFFLYEGLQEGKAYKEEIEAKILSSTEFTIHEKDTLDGQVISTMTVT